MALIMIMFFCIFYRTKRSPEQPNHLVKMAFMNYSKLNSIIESIFNSLKRSFNSYSDIFSPEFSITFLNSFFVNIEDTLPSFSLSFKLKIDLIASISYSYDSGSLYLLNLCLTYLANRARKSANQNCPFFSGSTIVAHSTSYFSVGFWNNERARRGKSCISKYLREYQRSYRCPYRRVGMLT